MQQLLLFLIRGLKQSFEMLTNSFNLLSGIPPEQTINNTQLILLGLPGIL
jgi:hypothetical protein